MNTFALAVQAAVSRHKTAARINWGTLSDGQFAPAIDSRLIRAQKLMNMLEIQGGGLDGSARLQAQKRLQNLMESLQEGGRVQLSRAQTAHVAERAAQGLNPQGSWVHRLSGGLFGTGPMGNPKKQVHRLKDLNSALQRAQGLVPENLDELVATAKAQARAAGTGRRAAKTVAAPPATAAGKGLTGLFKGLSTPTKFGLGAGAAAGGAYLLNRFMSNDAPESENSAAQTQQIWR